MHKYLFSFRPNLLCLIVVDAVGFNKITNCYMSISFVTAITRRQVKPVIEQLIHSSPVAMSSLKVL